MLKRLLATFILLPCLLQAETLWQEEHSEGISAEMQLSSRELHTGETLTLTLRLDSPENYELDMPRLRKQLLDAQSDPSSPLQFRVLGERQENYRVEEGRIKQTLHFELEPWLAGSYATPLQELQFGDKSGGRVVKLYPSIVEVRVSVEEGSADSKGAVANLLPVTDNPLIELNPELKENLLNTEEDSKEAQRNKELFEQRSFPWRILLAVLGMVLAAYGSRRLYQLLSQRGTVEKVAPDPHKKALQALQALIHERLPEQGLFDPFYVKLTDIVRHFVEDCYQVQAPEQTTEEFLAVVVDHPEFHPEEREALGQFLSHADLVKFANHSPTVTDCEQAVDSARNFVT